MGYKESISINQNNLEDELTNQPFLYMQYAEKYANAVKKRDICEDYIRVLKAQLFMEAKDEWKSIWGHKPTETEIKSWIEINDKLNKERDKLIQLEYNVNMYSSLLQALQQRKSILSSLVQMKISGIYSTPR